MCSSPHVSLYPVSTIYPILITGRNDLLLHIYYNIISMIHIIIHLKTFLLAIYFRAQRYFNFHTLNGGVLDIQLSVIPSQEDQTENPRVASFSFTLELGIYFVSVISLL